MARRFIAYAGPFSVDVANGTVTHRVDVSLFPNWQGDDQVRRVAIDGGRLSIIASDRTPADGRTFHSELVSVMVAPKNGVEPTRQTEFGNPVLLCTLPGSVADI